MDIYNSLECNCFEKKLVKCKTCGAEIAKSAKTCPNCGARQHIGVYIACAIIVLVTLFICIAVIIGSQGDSQNGTTTGANSGENDQTGSTIFAGETANVIYDSCFETESVSGCFYVQLQIENVGEAEAIYGLSDVYVDDMACNTGTGVPVKILLGKYGAGSFIIFTDKKLSDVNKIKFKFSVLDSESLDVIEVSDTITITPN